VRLMCGELRNELKGCVEGRSVGFSVPCQLRCFNVH
jgi:hypothetical protein